MDGALLGRFVCADVCMCLHRLFVINYYSVIRKGKTEFCISFHPGTNVLPAPVRNQIKTECNAAEPYIVGQLSPLFKGALQHSLNKVGKQCRSVVEDPVNTRPNGWRHLGGTDVNWHLQHKLLCALYSDRNWWWRCTLLLPVSVTTIGCSVKENALCQSRYQVNKSGATTTLLDSQHFIGQRPLWCCRRGTGIHTRLAPRGLSFCVLSRDCLSGHFMLLAASCASMNEDKEEDSESIHKNTVTAKKERKVTTTKEKRRKSRGGGGSRNKVKAKENKRACSKI